MRAVGVSQGHAVFVHLEVDAGAHHLDALEIGTGADYAVSHPSQGELIPRPQLAVALQRAYVERPHIAQAALAAVPATVVSTHALLSEKIYRNHQTKKY